jgi:hypothetical protein
VVGQRRRCERRDADVVERWRLFLPEFEFEALHLDKGASVLTRR